MSNDLPSHGLQLRSTFNANGEVEIELVDAPVPAPRPDGVVIRVEAAPINPSDLMMLMGPGNPARARFGGSSERPTVAIPVPEGRRQALAGRLGQSLQVGNEGAGLVVAAGQEARDLIGKRVAVFGGAMYAQYRVARARDCLVLPDDVTAAEGAAAFVNPLTALGMVETARREGHKGVIHTAAASNLGQMMVRLCQEERIPLVNVVRRPEQAALLRAMGAVFVVDSSAETFREDLIEAIRGTGATVAFDAIGGGRMGDQLLDAMEAVAAAEIGGYNRYGSSTWKQLYIYGALDPSPTELTRSYGLSWGVAGFLLFQFLNRQTPDEAKATRQRVADGLKTTFASNYTAKVTLPQALQRDAMLAYSRRATGEKYLITP